MVYCRKHHRLSTLDEVRNNYPITDLEFVEPVPVYFPMVLQKWMIRARQNCPVRCFQSKHSLLSLRKDAEDPPGYQLFPVIGHYEITHLDLLDRLGNIGRRCNKSSGRQAAGRKVNYQVVELPPVYLR